MKTLKKIVLFIFAMAMVFVSLPMDSVLADACMTGTYNQNEARRVFGMINSFRQGNDAWCWDEDSCTKIYIQGLPALQYDANLEKMAMQRAIELAVSFSHERPDGSMCDSVFEQYGVEASASGENIACGYKTADKVHNGFREDNEDFYGQGHRRNMLSSWYNAVGIGCVVVDGVTYWAEEFAYLDKITPYGNAVNGSKTMMINGNVETAGNSNMNGLTNVNGTWYYLQNGKVKKNYTGLCQYNGNWYYVQKGVLNWNYTGLSQYNGTWWYVRKGMVDFKATTLCYYNNTWWYVHNGAVDFKATTLCYYNNKWWYVRKGSVDFKATTLCYYNNKWWYVHNGSVDFNGTTLCYYNNKWWYVRYGAVDFNGTTLCYYNNKWWYVRYGAVDFNATTLCYYNNTWWYVHNGAVDFSYTGVAYYGNVRWYVQNGAMRYKISG